MRDQLTPFVFACSLPKALELLSKFLVDVAAAVVSRRVTPMKCSEALLLCSCQIGPAAHQVPS